MRDKMGIQAWKTTSRETCEWLNCLEDKPGIKLGTLPSKADPKPGRAEVEQSLAKRQGRQKPAVERNLKCEWLKC